MQKEVVQVKVAALYFYLGEELGNAIKGARELNVWGFIFA